MSDSKTSYFSKSKISSAILKQALPLTVAELANFLYSTIDRIYIGHIPDIGVDALSGVGFTIPFITIILGLTSLFGTGGTPLFSITLGAKEENKARKIVGNAFSMLLISSIVITIVSIVFMKPILLFFGANEIISLYASKYLNIYLLGTVFTMVSTGMNDYITAQGYPKLAMFTIVIGAIINAVIDPIFIFAFNLGIEGAAIATVISQFISCIWVMNFFFRDRKGIRLNKDSFKLDLKVCSRIILNGTPGFVMNASSSAVTIVANHTLMQYGGEFYVSIMTVVNSVCSIMRVGVNGITNGAKAVLGYNYGAGQFDRVKQGIRFSSLFAFVYSAVIWILIVLFPSFFFSIFTDDVALCEVGNKYLQYFFLAYVFMALQFSGQSTFMALGKAKPSICFSLLRKVILVIPLTIFLPMFLTDSNSGVFLAEPISNIIGGSASFLTMYFTVYRRLGKENQKKPR